MLKKMIKTVSGIKIEASKCRKLVGGYYIIGDITIKDSGECYFIPEVNKHINIESGQLAYDHSICRYVLKKNAKLIRGVIGFTEERDYILGYFSYLPGLNYNKIVIDRSAYSLLNDDIIKNNIKYKYYNKLNKYVDRGSIPSINFITIQSCTEEYKRSLSYDSRFIMDDYINTYNNTYEPEYSSSIKKYSPKIKGLSFGLEFETVKGVLPPSKLKSLGLIPLRDGSVSGIEYVTIPLEGQKGLQTVVDCVRELDANTTFDNNCSLHLHIGNIPRTESFILALYKMLYLVQDEMFEMFPLHKKYNYGIKRKHYTKPLDAKNTLLLMNNKNNDDSVIKNNFGILYKYLSQGHQYSSVNKDLKNVVNHPSDPDNRSKWNIRSRYHWVNLIPIIFGNKKTVEFRIHTPTTDINKVMNYIFICSGIINFVKEYEKRILTESESFSSLSLYDILSYSYSDNLLRELGSYINYRRQYFNTLTKNGDLVGDENKIKIPSNMKWDPKKSKTLNYFIDLNLYSSDEISSGKLFEKDQKKSSTLNAEDFFNSRTFGNRRRVFDSTEQPPVLTTDAFDHVANIREDRGIPHTFTFRGSNVRFVTNRMMVIGEIMNIQGNLELCGSTQMARNYLQHVMEIINNTESRNNINATVFNINNFF